jgi:hypothetical protein
MPGVDDDIEIARAAIAASRRAIIVKLLAHALENDPNKREAIMTTLSGFLARKKRPCG